MTHPTKEQGREDWEDALDTILGDFLCENSGDERVIVSIVAISKAKQDIYDLLASARSSERERVREAIEEMVKNHRRDERVKCPCGNEECAADLSYNEALDDIESALLTSPDPLTNSTK